MITSNSSELDLSVVPHQRRCKNPVRAEVLLANLCDHIMLDIVSVDDLHGKRAIEKTRIKRSLFMLAQEAEEKLKALDCTDCVYRCIGREIVFNAGVEKAHLLEQSGLQQTISLPGAGLVE